MGAGWNTPHVENTIFGAKTPRIFRQLAAGTLGPRALSGCCFLTELILNLDKKRFTRHTTIYALQLELRKCNSQPTELFFQWELIFLKNKTNRTNAQL